MAPILPPDKQTGLRKWSEADFKRAIQLGERRDDAHYFPASPYPSFTGMSDADIQDLWAFLKTLPPNEEREPRTHVAYSIRLPFPGDGLEDAVLQAWSGIVGRRL